MLALLGAIGGMVMVFAGRPGVGLLLAACAAILGAVGFFISASPRISGRSDEYCRHSDRDLRYWSVGTWCDW